MLALKQLLTEHLAILFAQRSGTVVDVIPAGTRGLRLYPDPGPNILSVSPFCVAAEKRGLDQNQSIRHKKAQEAQNQIALISVCAFCAFSWRLFRIRANLHSSAAIY
jgi:hypothetical protein